MKLDELKKKVADHHALLKRLTPGQVFAVEAQSQANPASMALLDAVVSTLDVLEKRIAALESKPPTRQPPAQRFG
jgi:hypothetical protein